MSRNFSMTLAALGAAALMSAVPSPALAQSPEKGTMQHHMQAEAGQADTGSKMDCSHMMATMKERQATQQQELAELEALTTRMNAASGADQQKLMAELLTRIVEHEGAMAKSMHDMMGGHMKQPMHADDEGSTSDCPMTKGAAAARTGAASGGGASEPAAH